VKIRPSAVSRDSVQVVLRTSTSTSPDCSAVKRSLAESGDELHLGRVVEDRRRDGAAEVDVEPFQLPCRIRHAEAGEAGVRAAIEGAAAA
jgi:hypothetical protein